MRVGGQTLARVTTLTNSHPRLTGPSLFYTKIVSSHVNLEVNVFPFSAVSNVYLMAWQQSFCFRHGIIIASRVCVVTMTVNNGQILALDERLSCQKQ